MRDQGIDLFCGVIEVRSDSQTFKAYRDEYILRLEALVNFFRRLIWRGRIQDVRHRRVVIAC